MVSFDFAFSQFITKCKSERIRSTVIGPHFASIKNTSGLLFVRRDALSAIIDRDALSNCVWVANEQKDEFTTDDDVCSQKPLISVVCVLRRPAWTKLPIRGESKWSASKCM